MYNYLRKLGHDVWILDYYCPPVEDIYNDKFRYYRAYLNRNIFSGVLQLFKDIYGNIFYQKKKKKAFTSFLTDNFQLTNRFGSVDKMPTGFDVLITGSDQVWGYKITEGRKEPYFLDIADESSQKPIRISFAASAEKDSFGLLKEDATYIKNALSKFRLVTVREQALVDLLQNEVGIESRVVLDPTFLLTREDYFKIAVKPKEKNYLCVYQVSSSKNLLPLARKIAQEKNLKIVEIRASLIANNRSDTYRPKEILGYLCYADFILTSSFHGTAFSIINRKDFYCVYDAPSARIQNVLSLFNFEGHFITQLDDSFHFKSVHYDDKRINEIIEDSKIVLNQINDMKYIKWLYIPLGLVCNFTPSIELLMTV